MLKLNFLKPVLSIIGLMFMVSCATIYTGISPENNDYVSTKTTDNVRLDYKYEILPKKYQKKADANAVKVISLKVTNNSGRDLIFGKDLSLVYDNGEPALLINNKAVYNNLSQTSEGYLLYLLLTPLKFISGGNVGSIGYVLGPGAALINFVTANKSNKQFKNELDAYNIIGMTIPNGITVDGIVSIHSKSYDDLKLVIN